MRTVAAALSYRCTVPRIRALRFPDLADEVMYPRLPEHKLAWLAEEGERRSFAPGEVLYAQGQPEAPFFVIESGRVDIIDRHPGKEVWIAEVDAGTFVGEIATFTGEPAIAEAVAAEPTETIAFDRAGLRAMLALGDPAFVKEPPTPPEAGLYLAAVVAGGAGDRKSVV